MSVRRADIESCTYTEAKVAGDLKQSRLWHAVLTRCLPVFVHEKARTARVAKRKLFAATVQEV
jgi:hypothetical protein